MKTGSGTGTGSMPIVPLRPHAPVCNVSRSEALQFCRWATPKAAYEAEWRSPLRTISGEAKNGDSRGETTGHAGARKFERGHAGTGRRLPPFRWATRRMGCAN